MLIYAVADIHGNVDRLRRIRAVVSDCQPDALVVAGDVINYVQPEKTFQALDQMGLPVLMVRGNSDPGYSEKYIGKFSHLTSLHLNRITVKSISFVGLSGTIPLPFRNRVRLFEKKLMEKASPLLDSQTVLVVHTPPWGVLDQVMDRVHSGSKRVRDLVEKTRPRLVICGHIHEAASVAAMGETLVVNCALPRSGRGMMIEVGGGQGCPEIEIG